MRKTLAGVLLVAVGGVAYWVVLPRRHVVTVRNAASTPIRDLSLVASSGPSTTHPEDLAPGGEVRWAVRGGLGEYVRFEGDVDGESCIVFFGYPAGFVRSPREDVRLTYLGGRRFRERAEPLFGSARSAEVGCEP
ncbi:MAG: hypothetical protein H6704_22495 [Myxococcales bacterium]|nr:hypothetical protein [Myxococcales bacterium]MCB9539008.1 hypothetical protein [Myxococcales bacterium]